MPPRRRSGKPPSQPPSWRNEPLRQTCATSMPVRVRDVRRTFIPDRREVAGSPDSHTGSRRRCNWSLFITHARASLFASANRAISGSRATQTGPIRMQRKALKQKLKSGYWREAMKTILSALVALSVLAARCRSRERRGVRTPRSSGKSRATTEPRNSRSNLSTTRRTAMKTIVSALLALSVLAGIAAAPAKRPSTPRASTTSRSARPTEPAATATSSLEL